MDLSFKKKKKNSSLVPTTKKKIVYGGWNVNGPKVAKFLVG